MQGGGPTLIQAIRRDSFHLPEWPVALTVPSLMLSIHGYRGYPGPSPATVHSFDAHNSLS